MPAAPRQQARCWASAILLLQCSLIDSGARIESRDRLFDTPGGVPGMTDLTAADRAARSAHERWAHPLDWVNIIGISFYHLVALLAFVPWFFSWTGVIVFFVGTYLVCTVGINVF